MPVREERRSRLQQRDQKKRGRGIDESQSTPPPCVLKSRSRWFETRLTPTRPHESRRFCRAGFNPPYARWWAIINPPTGQKLQVRRYQATRFGNATHAGLSVSGNGRGCNESTGTLHIKKLVSDSTGKISNIHAEVGQYCDGDTGPLRATIYYYTP